MRTIIVLCTCLWAFMALSISSLEVRANSGEIAGVVSGLEEDETLIGAHVRIVEGPVKQGAVTDSDGYYSLKPLPAGEYTLEFSYIGKSKLIKKGVRVGIDQIVMMDVALGNSNELTPFVVETYVVPLLEPGSPIGVQMTDKEIKKMPTRNVNDMISTATGIFQDDLGASFNVRGGRTGSTLFLIDGVKTESSVGVPANAIRSMQILTGGIPARYGDATGGVVVIETRSYNHGWD